MSKSGANFGTGLLWALLISCLSIWFLMSLCSRFTMVTRMTFMQGVRVYMHPALAVFLIVALSSVILSALIGVLGIVSDVLVVWIAEWTGRVVPVALPAAAVAAALFPLMARGRTCHFEQFLAWMVAIMALGFFLAAAICFPGWDAVAAGLVPRVPAMAEGSDNSALVVVAGMVGTTMSVFVLFIRTGLVRERGWTLADLRIERRDSAVSASLMFLISAAVLVAAAGTLHPRGIRLNHIAEMIPMLEPVFGSFAMGVFVIGIVAAGLSSHLPNMLMIPWLLDDYRGVSRNTRTPLSRGIILLLSLFSFAGVATGVKPVFLMLISQAFISVLMPLVFGALAWLVCRRRVMGAVVASRRECIALALIMLFSLYMSSQGLIGLWHDLFAGR